MVGTGDALPTGPNWADKENPAFLSSRLLRSSAFTPTPLMLVCKDLDESSSLTIGQR